MRKKVTYLGYTYNRSLTTQAHNSPLQSRCIPDTLQVISGNMVTQSYLTKTSGSDTNLRLVESSVDIVAAHSHPTAQQSNLARANDDSTQTHFNYVFLTSLLHGQVLTVTSDKWLTNLCDPAYVLQWVKEVHSRHCMGGTELAVNVSLTTQFPCLLQSLKQRTVQFTTGGFERGSIWVVYLAMAHTSLTRNANEGWGAAPFTRYPVARPWCTKSRAKWYPVKIHVSQSFASALVSGVDTPRPEHSASFP